MLTKTRLSLAVLAALGLSCASAFAMTNSMPADPDKVQSMDIHHPFGSLSQPLAKQGRGQDDTHPEDDVIDDGCDDHGDDAACGSAGSMPLLAKQGRGQDDTHPEDGVIDDGCDDHGDDAACLLGSAGSVLLLAKQGRGEDDTHPEDGAIDDGCDDHGIDGMCL